MAVSLALVQVVAAEQAGQPEETVELKTVTGELIMVRNGAISVEFSKTAGGSYEMFLPLAPDVKFAHVKGLEGLKRGDTVSVRYQQTIREGEEGEPIVVKTVATQIALVKSAVTAGLSSRETATE